MYSSVWSPLRRLWSRHLQDVERPCGHRFSNPNPFVYGPGMEKSSIPALFYEADADILWAKPQRRFKREAAMTVSTTPHLALGPHIDDQIVIGGSVISD
jgi:hypothetical protein